MKAKPKAKAKTMAKGKVMAMAMAKTSAEAKHELSSGFCALICLELLGYFGEPLFLGLKS